MRASRWTKELPSDGGSRFAPRWSQEKWMKRRDAGHAILLGLLAAGGAPFAHAQPAGKVYRIGYLSAPSRKSVEKALDAFLRALRGLGLVEGMNLIIEYRWAEWKSEWRAER